MSDVTTTTVQIGDFAVDIDVEDYEQGIDLQGGPWRKVVYQIPWDLVDGFMDYLMGGNKATSGLITFAGPHRYPGNEILHCLSCSARGHGVPKPGPKLFAVDGIAKVAAHYGVNQVDYGGDFGGVTVGGQAQPFLEQEIHGHTKVKQIETTAVKGKDTGKNPKSKFQFEYNCEEVHHTIHNIPFINVFPLRILRNKINSEVCLEAPIGFVKFADYSINRSRGPDGTMMSDLKMIFEIQPFDWNDVFVDDSLDMEELEDASTGDPIYQYADLNPLLDPNNWGSIG